MDAAAVRVRERLDPDLPHQTDQGIASAEAPATLTKIISVGWLIAILAAAVQTTAELVNEFVLAHAHPSLDATVDRNVFDWTSFCAVMVAASALLLPQAGVRPTGRRTAAVLAFLLTFLAIDDLTNIHDTLGTAFARTLPEPLDRVGDWSMPVLYLPLLALTFGLLWLQGRRASPAPGRQIRAALGLLATAVAIRVGVGLLEIGDIHASEGIRTMGVAVLEGMELGAWILLAAAFVAEVNEVRLQRPEARG